MSPERTKDCGLRRPAQNNSGLDQMDAEDSSLLQSAFKRRFMQDSVIVDSGYCCHDTTSILPNPCPQVPLKPRRLLCGPVRV